MKPETRFRINRIDPFLRRMRGVIFADSIQQVAKAGSPDYYLCVQGRLVALEAKTDEKDSVVSPIQALVHEKIRKAGGLVFVARPSNWEEVKDELVRLSRGEKP